MQRTWTKIQHVSKPVASRKRLQHIPPNGKAKGKSSCSKLLAGRGYGTVSLKVKRKIPVLQQAPYDPTIDFSPTPPRSLARRLLRATQAVVEGCQAQYLYRSAWAIYLFCGKFSLHYIAWHYITTRFMHTSLYIYTYSHENMLFTITKSPRPGSSIQGIASELPI